METKIKIEESQPGSARYAIEAANYYERTADRHDTMELSYTDLKLAAVWARYHASRWHRRVLVAAALVVTLAIGTGLGAAIA